MKVLFVNHFGFPDYQNDMVYHGLVDSGYDVYETAFPRYMLSTYPNPTSLYGRGFSIFAKLNHTPKVDSPEIIIEKIKSRFYDYVIFGSVWRDLSYLDEVIKYYKKDRVYFIDGEDQTNVKHELTEYGIYCKRECEDSTIKPITFSIPESQLLKDEVPKTKLFGTIIPGRVDTYVFHTEKDYYQDYATSYYGITHKKAGWDCMRHYEILANKCIPYFTDLSGCPKLTLSTFPKGLILETNEYAKKNEIHPNYDQLNKELFEYTRKNLTTKKLIETILCY
jgi:hypothetical protein